MSGGSVILLHHQRVPKKKKKKEKAGGVPKRTLHTAENQKISGMPHIIYNTY